MKLLLLLALFLTVNISFSQSLRLIYPNGGENFVAGEQMILRWETDDSTNLVEIEFSVDDGNTWNFLDTASGTSYLWKKVPVITRDKCIVKIQTVRKNNVQIVQTLRGHTSWVSGLSFNSDGSKLASSSLDYTAKVWDITNNKINNDLKGHTAYVECVAFNNNEENIITGCDRGFLRKWSLDSNKVFDLTLGHNSGIRSIVFSPNNQLFATTGKEDNDIKIWDYATLKIVQTKKGHQNPVWSTAFSPDGKYLVSSSIDQKIMIWDLDSTKAKDTLIGHSNSVSSVCYSNDGSLIVSASMDGEIKIWESSTGNILRSFSGGNNHVYTLALSPDNKTIAVGNEENKINLFDANSGELIKSFHGHENYILKLLFNPSTNTLASSSSDKTIKIWNLDAPEIPMDKSDSTFRIFIDPTSVRSSNETNKLFSVIQQNEKTVIKFEENSLNNNMSSLKVINAAGVLMEEKNLQITNNTIVEIDTEHYSSGLYFITLTTPTHSENASFVLVK